LRGPRGVLLPTDSSSKFKREICYEEEHLSDNLISGTRSETRECRFTEEPRAALLGIGCGGEKGGPLRGKKVRRVIGGESPWPHPCKRPTSR